MRGSETGNGYRLRSTAVHRSKRAVLVFSLTIKTSTGSNLREEVGRNAEGKSFCPAIQNNRFVIFENQHHLYVERVNRKGRKRSCENKNPLSHFHENAQQFTNNPLKYHFRMILAEFQSDSFATLISTVGAGSVNFNLIKKRNFLGRETSKLHSQFPNRFPVALRSFKEGRNEGRFPVYIDVRIIGNESARDDCLTL